MFSVSENTTIKSGSMKDLSRPARQMNYYGTSDEGFVVIFSKTES